MQACTLIIFLIKIYIKDNCIFKSTIVQYTLCGNYESMVRILIIP